MNTLIRYLLLSIFIFLPTVSCTFAADTHAIGPKTTVSSGSGKQRGKGEIPSGAWCFTRVLGTPIETTTVKHTLTITAGVASRRMVEEMAFKPGYHCAYGKFEGLHRIAYTTISSNQRVVRIGNELYIYQTKEKLIAGDPPGYSLLDYQTGGGAGLLPLVKTDNAVWVVRIEGKNLVDAEGSPTVWKLCGTR